MGKKGHERVQERFMEEHMAHRIGQVLQTVMNGGGKRQQQS
jgi:hypothetical protein